MYINPNSIKSAKVRKAEERKEASMCNISPKKLRTSQKLNLQKCCFMCTEEFPSKYKPSAVRYLENVELKKNMEKKGLERNDKFGLDIYLRLSEIEDKDIMKLNLRYHNKCNTRFGKEVKESDRKSGRPLADYVSDSVEKIIQYIDENDDCQFSLHELLLLVEDPKPDIKTLKNKLLEHYGDKIIITANNNKVPTVCLKSVGHSILSDAWYENRKSDPKAEKLRVIEMAANIIREEITSTVYDVECYPNSNEFLNNIDELIPKSLQFFIDKLMLKKAKKNVMDQMKKKGNIISHIIISSLKPRSFHSPLKLSIASWIYKKIGSKNLIDMLSYLGICSSYHDVKVLESSLVMSNDLIIDKNALFFIQYVFDNCDFNVNTIDGYNTFHNKAGIVIVTPTAAIKSCDPEIKKHEILNRKSIVEKKGTVEVKEYISDEGAALNSFKFDDLENLYEYEKYPDTPSSCDALWMASQHLELPNVPGWHGFMKKISRQEFIEMSKVINLPFIINPPSNEETIFTALRLAAAHAKNLGFKFTFVTFDLPLYMKALQILLSVPPESELSCVVLRLGGFHLLMSFLGCIGHIMADSGLKELLCTIYAENSVDHILTGHAYARAVRAHILTQLALVKILFKNINLTNEEEAVIKEVIENLELNPMEKSIIEENEVVKNICSKLKNEILEKEKIGKLAKLWIQYIKMVTLMKNYIEAERCGDFD